MTDESPDAGKSKNPDFETDTSDSGSELANIEPRPVEEEEEGQKIQEEAPTTKSDCNPIPSDHGDESKRDDAGKDNEDENDGAEDDSDGEEVEDNEDVEDIEEDSDEDEDDEPKLKYARLTQHLSAVYRNADMTSAFLVAGDKMLVGTHNGNINVVQLPMFQSIRVYHAHQTSVTGISMSPFPPPLPPTTLKSEVASRAVSQAMAARRAPSQHSEQTTSSGPQRRSREPLQLPNIPSNNIFIGTSSMDGNVCVQSLIDMTDVSLRNFARPIQAVALSPDYKNDRTYVSGGKAGSLVLTVNPPRGKSTSTTVGTAAATASGWLGSVGLGTNTGKDTVLHSGEGTISNIKWSLSGKYLAWLNEHGIKIMRTKMHLDSADAENAWKRVGHVDRPQTDEWEEMAGVWKGRAEWIDEQAVENDEDGKEPEVPMGPSAAANKLKQTAARASKNIERLLIGWGGTIWIIHIHPGRMGVGRHAGEKSAGHAEIAKKLRMDCIISGISLYTQNQLLVLAYCKPDPEEEEEDDLKKHAKGHQAKLSTASSGSEPSGGRRRRQNALAPELRLIDLKSQAEVDKDSLTVSRFESLSSNDYHLGVLPAGNAASVVASRGVLDAMAGFGSEMWNAAINPRSLFSSGASIRSNPSNENASGTQAPSTAGNAPPRSVPQTTVHPNLVKPGAKIFIHSPFDCILATKRDLADHLEWLLQQQRYEDAWSLLDDHPEIMVTPPEKATEAAPATPELKSSSDYFFEDTSSMIESQPRVQNSSAEKEKRRIGELWLQELVEARDWTQAGQVAAKVLNTADQWEKWIFNFAGAKKFDEIVNFIPSKPMRPPIPGTAYEIVLGHYIQKDLPHFKELLERWDPNLFDVQTVTTALENQLQYRDVREDSVEDGERGRDWRIVMESLAHLQELNGRHREALRHYIKLQDADSVMRLIRDNHLADAVTDDVPSFIALRVPESQLSRMTLSDIDEATSEAITLLVNEAQRGLIKPDVVVRQLEKKELNRYLFFYLRGLWRAYRERPIDETISLVDEYADLAVQLFAEFDRGLLMDFLRVSTSYVFEKAAQECESHNYIQELVYLYSKTGQMKRALYLIIDRLGDVSQAIAFAKEQGDPDLWEDLLDYSMDKPQFIQGLLEEVGTAIDPITLVRRIPEGLEIPGLRDGLKHIMKEHEIQYSISSGVARVLRSEVSAAQNLLRMGQRKGIKFEVKVKAEDHVDVKVKEVATLAPHKSRLAGDGSGTETPTAADTVEAALAPSVAGKTLETQQPDHDHRAPQPGHCSRCHEPFSEYEMETLVGFGCGHVFHVSHLLEQLHPEETPDPGLVGIDDGEDRMRNGRFVRSKVTHARLLRDKIEAGCPVCTDRRKVVGDVMA